jgi:hypothetical protein
LLLLSPPSFFIPQLRFEDCWYPSQRITAHPSSLVFTGREGLAFKSLVAKLSLPLFILLRIVEHPSQ